MNLPKYNALLPQGMNILVLETKTSFITKRYDGEISEKSLGERFLTANHSRERESSF